MSTWEQCASDLAFLLEQLVDCPLNDTGLEVPHGLFADVNAALRARLELYGADWAGPGRVPEHPVDGIVHLLGVDPSTVRSIQFSALDAAKTRTKATLTFPNGIAPRYRRSVAV